MTTTVTRPACADCYFWITISDANTVGECRAAAPITLAAPPQTKSTYWCGAFVLPPAGSVVTS